MREKTKNKKVIVAMSGGVDSSVAAALLKKEGYDVVGVFMKFWQSRIDTNKTDSHRFENRCCSSEAEKRARVVAAKLKIPFYVFNFEKEFKKKIVDYFLKEYKTGRTPNPCVVCNKEIKFGLLLKKVLALNADFIATGHYVRVVDDSRQCIFRLYKARDKKKDQSYFLWQLNQKILKRTLFPVGNYAKEEVRKLAKKFKLPNYNAPESQEICFVQTTVNDFLKKYIKNRPGPVVEQVHYGVKKIIGEHQGLWFYTIGQKKGIDLAGGPFYVLDKDIKKNILIVTQNENDLYKKELIVKDVNWIHPVKCCEAAIPPKAELFNRVKVKIRYKHEPGLAMVRRNKIIFDKPQRAITPGQSVVFYKGQELLGGGVIS